LKSLNSKKIAIISDWLVVCGGAEKVLYEIIKCFPEADLFALIDFVEEKDRWFLHNKPVKTSFMQKIPLVKKYYRKLLSLMPYAIEQFNLSQYDLVISSSHAVAKGVITGPNQLHICYCHSPMRYAWDLQHQYLEESGLNKSIFGIIAKYQLHKMRIWDYRTAHGVDYFIANSAFIAKRISKVYGRKATVIYPPVSLPIIKNQKIEKSDYYIVISRLVPYKKIMLIAETFAQLPDKELVIIGDGPDKEKIAKIATCAKNIKMLGYLATDMIHAHLLAAKAYICIAEEDFGIATVEAQHYGLAVIGYAKGGTREIVQYGNANKLDDTGILFDEQSIQSLSNAIHSFEANCSLISAANCKANAEQFSSEHFRNKLISFVANNSQEKLPL
jgi:glycosyltransferase involved in cell wall biosynthesis